MKEPYTLHREHHIEKATERELFYCTNNELCQITYYYATLLADYHYCQPHDRVPVVEDSKACEDIVRRRIGKIAKILGGDTVDGIVKSANDAFNRKMGAEFDRNYTDEAVTRLRDYKKHCFS